MDDTVILTESATELQNSLNILSDFCNCWKLKINKDKMKVMILQKGGRIPNNVSFNFEGNDSKIVKSFRYLGIVFTSGSSLYVFVKHYAISIKAYSTKAHIQRDIHAD